MYFIIYSGENDFEVLGISVGSSEKAWDYANYISTNYLETGVHYDVLGGFGTVDELSLEVRTLSSDSTSSDNLRMVEDFKTGKQNILDKEGR